MGTSNSYGGPGRNTPLVPTWLGGAPEPIPPDENTDKENQPNKPEKTPGKEENKPVPDQSKPSISPFDQVSSPTSLPPPSSDRYRQPRINFNRFAKSGSNSGRSLGKAVSGYVSKSSGGPRTAAKKMGSSRRTTIGLVNFLNTVRTQGAEAALTGYNLGNLVGQSIENIFLGLIDYICPAGGNVDEGIARNAFIETIADLAVEGITDLNGLTEEQLRLIVEIYATHAIESRLCNDIGTKICIAPDNIPLVERAQGQLHDFIRRGVADALNTMQNDFTNLTATDTAKFVDEIYIESFTMLQTLGEIESDAE